MSGRLTSSDDLELHSCFVEALLFEVKTREHRVSPNRRRRNRDGLLSECFRLLDVSRREVRARSDDQRLRVVGLRCERAVDQRERLAVLSGGNLQHGQSVQGFARHRIHLQRKSPGTSGGVAVSHEVRHVAGDTLRLGRIRTVPDQRFQGLLRAGHVALRREDAYQNRPGQRLIRFEVDRLLGESERRFCFPAAKMDSAQLNSGTDGPRSGRHGPLEDLDGFVSSSLLDHRGAERIQCLKALRSELESGCRGHFGFPKLQVGEQKRGRHRVQVRIRRHPLDGVIQTVVRTRFAAGAVIGISDARDGRRRAVFVGDERFVDFDRLVEAALPRVQVAERHT